MSIEGEYELFIDHFYYEWEYQGFPRDDNGDPILYENYKPNDSYCNKCTWRNNPNECALGIGDKEPCPGHDEKPCKSCGLNPCICYENGDCDG